MPGRAGGGSRAVRLGHDAANAAHNAVVLEELAEMATRTLAINPQAGPVAQKLLDKHYFRKHGANASTARPPGKPSC